MLEKLKIYSSNGSLSTMVFEQLLSFKKIPNLFYQVLKDLENYNYSSDEALFILNETNSFKETALKLKIKRNGVYIGSSYPSQNMENISLIGSQRHLLNSNREEEFRNILNLGTFKNSTYHAEPYIRESKHVICNLDVLRKAEIPEVDFAHPSGLYTEQLTQLFRYAGMAEGLNQCQILNVTDHSIELLAQLIWYFAEAAKVRSTDHPYFKNSVHEFIVETNTFDEPLSFYKSIKTARWWMKIPNIKENQWASCSYEDYEMACNNELSDRIMNVLSS